MNFGSDALIQYAEIVEDDKEALMFANYKMELLHLIKNVKSSDGRRIPLMFILSETIRFLAKKAMSKLRQMLGKSTAVKVRWVLTVPALWTENHKNIMKRAAVKAGLCDEVNSPDLLLCLEPEGASIQCREDADVELKDQMMKGSVIMVLDCGGGTVDITIHELLCERNESFLCKELLPSSGGCDWGSKYVDLYFEDFLMDFFGEKLYEIYLKSPTARLDVLRDFEILKRKFKGEGRDRCLIKLSSLGQFMDKKIIKFLVEKFNKKNNEKFHVKLKGFNNLELPSPLVKSFFHPLLENIKGKVMQLIQDICSKGENLDFIFLVGGFSESPFLKKEISRTFEPMGINILVPRRPQVSVIRGACMYGLNPRFITSRIAKKTYGINTITCFDSQKHPKDKRVFIEGEAFCEDIFDAFVRAGDTVTPNEAFKKMYCPVRTTQTVMKIIFYASDLKHVYFIDDPRVEKLGRVSNLTLNRGIKD